MPLTAKRDREEKEGQSQSGSGPRVENNEEVDKAEKGESDSKKSPTTADTELAASKIQAGFRGYKTRKALKEKAKRG